MTDRPQPPSLTDLAAAERDAAPDPAAEARVWAAVEHRLSHGPPPPALPEPAGVLLKWIGGLVLVGGVAGGALLWPRDVPPEPPVPPPVHTTRPAALAPGPEDMSPAPWPIVQVAPPAAPAPGPTLKPPRQRPTTVEPAPDEPLDLAAELRLIAKIRAALQRGDTAAALADIDVHRRKFGRDGALIEERSAHEVEALCAAGRGREARRLASEFLQRWPQSPQRARVAASCAE